MSHTARAERTTRHFSALRLEILAPRACFQKPILCLTRNCQSTQLHESSRPSQHRVIAMRRFTSAQTGRWVRRAAYRWVSSPQAPPSRPAGPRLDKVHGASLPGSCGPRPSHLGLDRFCPFSSRLQEVCNTPEDMHGRISVNSSGQADSPDGEADHLRVARICRTFGNMPVFGRGGWETTWVFAGVAWLVKLGPPLTVTTDHSLIHIDI
jgi:hypothetical protein